MQIAQKKVRQIYESYHGIRIVLTVLGIAVNAILAFAMNRLGLPLFLDSFGTIAVSAVSGILFSGMLTAVASSVICSLFFSASVYFSLSNALIAMCTVWFVRRHSFKSVSKTLLFVLSVVVYSALVNTAVQLALFGEAQTSLAAQNARSLSTAVSLPYPATFCFVNFLMSLLDKGFAFVFSVIIANCVSREKLQAFQNAAWQQRPLTETEIRSLKEWSRDIRLSLKTRHASSLVITSLVLILIMGWSCVKLFFNNIKSERTRSAYNCVQFAASVINPESVDDFITYGRSHPDYASTEALLYNIWKVSSGVKYLYALRVEENGCRFIFDLDTTDDADDEPYEPGHLEPFTKEFEPEKPALLSGNEIPPIESNSLFGWLLTVYQPVRDSAGRCVCYVGADISLDYMAEYLGKLILHIVVIMAGFFLLIIAYAVWTTGVYTAYPISSMAACVDSFAHTGENQEKLDENVQVIRSLGIHTGDEVEKLYKAICRMTLNQAEQMRDIRRLSESTLKMQDGLIITMADMVENRDSDTGAHIQKTAAYVKIIVEGLQKKGYYAQKITPKFMSDVVRSAPLHDVGKINISDGVLNKPGKLTDEEFAIMKTHTTAGKQILENAISTVQGENYLKEARNMAAYHHERWDGKGYPEGLHGEVIPLSARIMAVADVFDALTSPRVYKPAFPLEKALAILQEGSGTQFDPKCIEVFMDALPEVKTILKKYNPQV
ncbi:MAG: HD domain-containing protein [Treponema sp.]|nr:HD domain-containing protein [Treponema sp.]